MTPETAAKINTYVCAQGAPKTSGQARSLLHHWLVVMGLRQDRYGNYPLEPAKDGQRRRIQFGDKVFRRQWRDDQGGWHNSASQSLIEAAMEIATKAAKLTPNGFSCNKHEDCKVAPELGAVCSQERVIAMLEGKKEKRKETAAKSEVRRQAEDLEKNGPGFYVTTTSTTAGKRRLADQEKPYKTLEEAIERARSKRVEVAAFQHLHPVLVISADSRAAAERANSAEEVAAGHVHLWWYHGRFIGPPADPRQLRFQGMVAGRTRPRARAGRSCGCAAKRR